MSNPATPGGWPDPSTPSADPHAPAGGGAPLPGAAPAYPPPGPGYGPGGYPPPYGYPGPGYPPPYGYPPRPPQTNGMAVAALVCALSGLFTYFSAPVGAILGHVARRQIRERGEEGDGMALAGIIVGWIITGLGLLGCVAYFALIGAFVWAVGSSSGGY